ncbi:MAG TPA: lipase maturation factor family protein [Chthoniobacterales bacterium]|nr:lipase maturation factor family protein [Chthoniobacterales bacterium]
MSPAPHLTVRNAPPKPLLIFDGDCHFCRRWIERWRELTAGAVEYAPFQEVAERFPEIPREAFDRSVQFIETDGTVFSGAEAVFRSLGHKRRRRWLIWCYERVPGFAAITETAYRLVARNRRAASFFTRLLWGQDVRQPAYFESRRWFLRSLGCVYLIAFLSLWMQVDGLIGEKGILPVAEFLPAARAHLGGNAPFVLPTLCWLNASNAFLHFLCGAGAVLSVLLIAGFLPVISLVLLFVSYLSLTIAGQTFLSFQWDILLLETGFLAIFFAPFRWRPGEKRDKPFSPLGHFLLKLLLFKLMLMSGVVKLTSGDDSWWNLTALDYHYWTQPLPTVFGWWAHQAPASFGKLSTFFVLFVECVVPFFIWAPRRVRHLACALFVMLQLLIALTGNYCFFNLLTIALCLLLIDDAAWPRKRSSVGRDSVEPSYLALSGSSGSTESRPTVWAYGRRICAISVLLVLLPLNAMLIFSAFKPRTAWPRPIAMLGGWVAPFHIVNGYGLFRVMTKSRPEIILEGSADGIDWLPYEFRWKPGDLNQPPHWVAPHQPRLDWQMWFAALGTYRQNPWFVGLTRQLLGNNPEVTRLLGHNPFPDKPPLYVRSTVYDYHFTTLTEHRATGAWWKREIRREYLPPVSLGDFRND